MCGNNDAIPLYVIGLPKEESVNAFIASKFQDIIQKGKKVLPEIIEVKISIKSQNPEGTRTHYDVTSTIFTSKNNLIHTESGWDILKICEELGKKLEKEFCSRNDKSNKRQRESIRKKEEVKEN
ncbi:MAG: HPF/RaiA family ribosome-associated protein [Nitrosopumilus sp.]